MLELVGITRTFGSIVANSDATLRIRRGQIVGLVGENGAGKTTLMRIASGLLRPTHGEVKIDGKPQQFRSPLDAISMGVHMVHQHFMLVANISVAENVVLGVRGLRPWLDVEDVSERVATLSEQYGLKVDPRQDVWRLSLAERQRVEILAALFRGCRYLILDEPTSVLLPAEVESLFNVIRALAAEGVAVVFISHKLGEVLAISDHISVMRAGRIAASVMRSEADTSDLARLMIGRSLERIEGHQPLALGAPVLEVEGLTVYGDRGELAVDQASLEVSHGEMLGIAGVSGNGQRELCESLAGTRLAATGRIVLRGQDITTAPAAARTALGIAFVPEDPRQTGLVLSASVAWNVGLRHYRTHRRLARLEVDYRALGSLATELISAFDIRGASASTEARNLSGGNLQKLVIARELCSAPRLIIIAQPTVGLDVGAARHVHQTLLSQRSRGAAIVLVSADLDEIVALSDRVAVMFRGRIAGMLTREEAQDRTRLGLLMAGLGQ